MKLRMRQTGEEYTLEDGLVVGRNSQCGLVIQDVSVSRQHARVMLRADGFWIEDLGSSNGTARNGRKEGQFELRPGDLISFGAVAFDVVGVAAATSPAAAADFPAAAAAAPQAGTGPAAAPSAPAPIPAAPAAPEADEDERRVVRERARLRHEIAERRPSRGWGDLSQQPLWVRLAAMAIAAATVVGVALAVRWLGTQF